MIPVVAAAARWTAAGEAAGARAFDRPGIWRRIDSAAAAPEDRNWLADALRLLVLGAVAAAVLALLLRDVRISDVARRLQAANSRPLLGGVLLTGLFPILAAWRWSRIVRAMDKELPFARAFRLGMACGSLSAVTPTKVGDPAKAFFLRDSLPVAIVLGSILAERLLDLLVLLSVVACGSLLLGWHSLALASGGALVAACGLALLLMHAPAHLPARFRPVADRLLEAIRALASRPRLFFFLFVVTLGFWLATVLQAWLFYRAVGAPVPLGRILTVLPAAVFVGLVPITLPGLGTRDAALVGFLTAGTAVDASASVGVLYSLCGYWLPGAAGIVFLRAVLRETRWGSRIRKAK